MSVVMVFLLEVVGLLIVMMGVGWKGWVDFIGIVGLGFGECGEVVEIVGECFVDVFWIVDLYGYVV